MQTEFSKKIANATKWSTITEVMAKLIAPITSLILVRVLAPDVFGIVASVNVVISFCELFTDAGFQKYIIQHEIEKNESIYTYANIAFWTNLFISTLFLSIICVFANDIATLVGCPGKSLAIVVACINLPLTSFSSVQTALLKRELNFRPLFFSRAFTVLVPILVTLPLAFITKSYWSIIIGTIVSNIVTVITMFFLLDWRPRFEYALDLLKKMLHFSSWALSESVLVWVINWGDIFIVGTILTSYYLGLYQTSMNLVNQIFSIISASVVPVLFSALSRMQSDNSEFAKIYYRFTFLSGMLLIPMGIGLFIFRETVCYVALGTNWMDSATLIGTWGLISAFAILFNSYASTVLIAKGKPKLSVIIQIIQIIFIIPTVYFSSKASFECLSYARAAVRVIGMMIYSYEIKRIAGISIFHIINKLYPAIIATVGMGILGIWVISLEKGHLINLLGIIACGLTYIIFTVLFPNVRQEYRGLLNRVKN